MSDGFTVYPPDLRVHAEALGRHRDRISTARSAAGSAGLGVESFGILCQFFALDAQVHAGTAKRCIGSLRDAVDQMAGGIRDTAEVYEGVDEANRAIFQEGGW